MRSNKFVTVQISSITRDVAMQYAVCEEGFQGDYQPIALFPDIGLAQEYESLKQRTEASE